MVRCDSKKKYQKSLFLEEIGLRVQNMVTILGSIVTIVVATYTTIQEAWESSH